MNVPNKGGMICLQCGGRTRITYTSLNIYGTKRIRLHVCRKCGRNFETEEVQPIVAETE